MTRKRFIKLLTGEGFDIRDARRYTLEVQEGRYNSYEECYRCTMPSRAVLRSSVTMKRAEKSMLKLSSVLRNCAISADALGESLAAFGKRQENSYGIWCTRDAASVFGADAGWWKPRGTVREFSSLEEASDAAEQLTRLYGTENIRYGARAYGAA